MFEVMGATHVGMVRSCNQDRYSCGIIADDCAYALVCDGMGGENGGNIASTLACDEIRRAVETSYSADLDEKGIYMVIEQAIEKANSAVYNRASQDEELRGMGTTASLAVVLRNECYIANVGDSRVYLLRDHSLKQLTTDHTRVQMLLDDKVITADEAKNHPERHYLTKAVGVGERLTPAYCQTTVAQGDILLLCSDGLYNMVSESTLVAMLERVANGDKVEILIDEANRLGGGDNITAVLVQVK